LATFLRESSNPRNDQDAANNGSNMSPSVQTLTHSMSLLTPLLASENKSAIEITQQFPWQDTVSLEHFKNEKG